MTEPKKPEFVIIEEEHAYKQEGSAAGEQQFFESFQSIKKKKNYSWIFNVACFFGTVFVTMGIIVTSLFVGAFFFVDLVSLFQVEGIHKQFLKMWRLWRKLFAFFVSFFVGIFSPQFGVGILILYLLLQGDELQDDLMVKIFKRGM